MAITSLSQLDFSQKYTYGDYIKWQFKERVELLKGIIFPMAAPNVTHQRISSDLHWYLVSYFRKRKCDVFHAPFDVRLPLPKNKIKGNKINTIVQPDLCVVYDAKKLDKQGCVGAPDLVVEILSPGNSKREMRDKFELYEAAGVLEYWIVSPNHKTVLIYVLKDGKFTSKGRPLTDEDILTSELFEGLEIQLNDVFPKEEVED